MIPKRAFELESLKAETKRLVIKEEYFAKENYPSAMKPDFSTSSSNIEFKPNFIGSQICFIPDDIVRKLLGFHAVSLYENKIYHLILLIYYLLIMFSLKLILLKE